MRSYFRAFFINCSRCCKVTIKPTVSYKRVRGERYRLKQLTHSLVRLGDHGTGLLCKRSGRDRELLVELVRDFLMHAGIKLNTENLIARTPPKASKSNPAMWLYRHPYRQRTAWF